MCVRARRSPTKKKKKSERSGREEGGEEEEGKEKEGKWGRKHTVALNAYAKGNATEVARKNISFVRFSWTSSARNWCTQGCVLPAIIGIYLQCGQSKLLSSPFPISSPPPPPFRSQFFYFPWIHFDKLVSI